jgi:hypothetical protein
MEKIRVMLGVEVAINLLRPGATWEVCNNQFAKWDDPRPCPSWEEVMDTMQKIKDFEDSINTIWLPEQLKVLNRQRQTIEDAFNADT